MANEINRSDRDRTFPKWIFGAPIALWLCFLFMPLFALRCSWFELDSPKEVGEVASVLSQLGTYGDMFGLLNCLFSGLALIGVAGALLLQHQDSVRQEGEAEKASRSADLQNRLAAYQSMADHHRYQRDNALRSSKKDILLEARSRGREIAYAEKMKFVLIEIEAHAAKRDVPKPQKPYNDHLERVRDLNHFYLNDRDLVTNPGDNFDPVEEHLLELVEEIAALTELVKDDDPVQDFLLDAGHSINAAVEPTKPMDNPEATAKEIREYQVMKADLAFKSASEAVRTLELR